MDSNVQKWVHEDASGHPLSTVAGSVFQNNPRRRILRAYVVPVDTAAIITLLREQLPKKDSAAMLVVYEGPEWPPEKRWQAVAGTTPTFGATALSAALRLYQAVASP